MVYFSCLRFLLFIGMITKAVLKSSEEEKKEEEVKKTLEQHDSIVTQYKELIREQVKKKNIYIILYCINLYHILTFVRIQCFKLIPVIC